MDILNMLAGPLIGAAIGYCTNYIAVKMLFYPRQEIRIFGRRLPFTPGAIPKGQPRLAKAIGAVIETHLLTREDITSKLLSEAAETRVADTATKALSVQIKEGLQSMGELSDEAYEQKRAALCRSAGQQIVGAIQSSGITETLLNEVAASLREKAMGTGWRLLVNSKPLGSLLGPARERLDRAIDRHGVEYIAPVLERELSELDSGTGLELLARFGRDEEALRAMVIRTYRKLVTEHAADLLQSFHIAALVEDKINAMSVAELERLVWGVMRKELNTIINLGAVIGLVLGLLNVIF